MYFEDAFELDTYAAARNEEVDSKNKILGNVALESAIIEFTIIS